MKGTFFFSVPTQRYNALWNLLQAFYQGMGVRDLQLERRGTTDCVDDLKLGKRGLGVITAFFVYHYHVLEDFCNNEVKYLRAQSFKPP